MNRAKLKALVHYIIAKSDPSRLGAIRLNKILFYIDSIAFRSSGQSVTGEVYIKRQLGPVPKDILNILGELEHEDAIVIRDRPLVGKSMREYISRRSADTSSLSKDDLELAEEVRSEICDTFTANGISTLSHDKVWEAANIGEVIPLAATLVADEGEFTEETYKWADSVVARYEAIERAA
jgi:hypothetical protein